MTTPAWLDVLDEALRESAVVRPDLANRLAQLRARFLQPSIRVLIAGRAKEGKSQLINALVNAPVCPVDDQVTTVVPTVVRYAASPQAELLKPGGPPAGPATGETEAVERVPVGVDSFAAEMTALARTSRDRELLRAEVGLPRAVLAAGLVLVDWPSIDHLGPARAREAFTEVDVVLLVSDANHALTPAELDFLAEAARACPNVASVRTKTDLSGHWRDIVAADGRALAKISDRIVTLPASSTLRLRAASTNDKELNEESGFPSLIAYLQQRITYRSEVMAPQVAARAVLAVIDQIAPAAKAGLAGGAALDESAPMRRLRTAQRRAADVRRRAAHWQLALSDGMTELLSDVDHDLRERTRNILREADRTFDRADPLKVWDEFAGWLVANLSEAVLANFGWAAERARWLTRYLAGFFADVPACALPALALELPPGVEEGLAELERPAIEPVRIGHKIVTGLRGSYSGVLMFGMLSTVSGLSLINPISLGAGALLGTRSIREEGSAQLKRRQATAKAAVQRHVDEAVFQASKYGRDTLRQVQRRLRDHFTVLTEELQEAVTESVTDAAKAANRAAMERDRRDREAAALAGRLMLVRRRAEALLSTRTIAA